MPELERRGARVPPAPAAKLISISQVTPLPPAYRPAGSRVKAAHDAMVSPWTESWCNYGSGAVSGVLDGMYESIFQPSVQPPAV